MSEWKNILINSSHNFDFPIHRSYYELSNKERKLLWSMIEIEDEGEIIAEEDKLKIKPLERIKMIMTRKHILPISQWIIQSLH